MGNVASWVIGVTLSLSACLMGSAGMNVQKLAHQRRQRQLAGGGGEGEEQWRWQTVWTAGLALVLAGALLDLASFAFAAVSLLAPLGAMTLLVNLVVAPWLVGERPSASDVANTLLIFAGAIVTVVFGSKDEPSYDLQALEALYFQPAVYAYAALFVAYVGGVLAALAHLDRRRVHSPAAERFRALAFPSVAGAFGSASVLFAKSVGQLALTTVQGANQFGHGETYALLVALLTAVGLQTALLNRGLALHAVLFVVPVYQAFWVVSSCAVGMLYFGDYHTMSYVAIGLFFVGVAITVFGIILLSLRPETDAAAPLSLSLAANP